MLIENLEIHNFLKDGKLIENFVLMKNPYGQKLKDSHSKADHNKHHHIPQIQRLLDLYRHFIFIDF